MSKNAMMMMGVLIAAGGLNFEANGQSIIASDDSNLFPVANDLTIDVPEFNLQPDMAGQSVDLFVSNAGADFSATGFKLVFLVADGGPNLPGNPGVTPGPAISSVNILTGTPFETNNQGQVDFAGGARPPGAEQVFISEVSIPPANQPSIIGAGSTKIASVTFDTTGFLDGAYSLSLTALGDTTKFTGTGQSPNEVPVLIGGSITVVPEPNIALVVAGALSIGCIFRRRNQERSLSTVHSSVTAS